jgi:hypothetical protein
MSKEVAERLETVRVKVLVPLQSDLCLAMLLACGIVEDSGPEMPELLWGVEIREIFSRCLRAESRGELSINQHLHTIIDNYLAMEE